MRFFSLSNRPQYFYITLLALSLSIAPLRVYAQHQGSLTTSYTPPPGVDEPSVPVPVDVDAVASAFLGEIATQGVSPTPTDTGYYYYYNGEKIHLTLDTPYTKRHGRLHFQRGGGCGTYWDFRHILYSTEKQQ